MADKPTKFVAIRFDMPGGYPNRAQSVSIGPYYSVGVYPDGMKAYADDHTLPVIAHQVPGGWQVNGLEGQVFESFTFFNYGSRDES